LGKLIGSFLGLATGLLLAIGVGCLLLPIMGVPMSAADWFKLVLIALAGLLYFGVFLTLAIFVSAATRRSATSFLVLLVLWIGCVLIIPRSSVLIAGRAVDVPSVDELATQKSIFAAGLWDEFRTGMQTLDVSRPSAGAVYGGAQSEQDPNEMMRRLNQRLDSLSRIRETRMNEFAGRLNEQRHNAQRRQERLALSLARLSPATSLSLAATNLAGTAIGLKDRFHDAATQYQLAYRAFLKEKTGMDIGGARVVIRTSGDEDTPPEPINPFELPAFDFPQPDASTVLQQSILDLGLLALFNLLFFAGAFVAFLRYDLR
jgi:ABC-2 type transport system permease protein